MQNFLESHHLFALFKASWQAAVLIVLVLAVQWALGRRLSPRWRYALWLLVVVRLALPWTAPSAVSLFNLFSFPKASAAILHADPNLPVPTRASSQSVTDVRPGPPAPDAVAASSPAADRAGWWTSRGISGLLLLWAAGALALGGYLALTQWRIFRRVAPRRPLIDAAVLNLLEDCKQTMGVHTPVTLVETPQVGSPALFGFMRPRLLLPQGLTRSFSLEELRYVFLHELSHIKRNDILTGWLMTGLQIVHWFNPLVWLAFYRMRVDRELACDALALSYTGEGENQPYGRTMIKLLEGFGCSAWAPSLAGTLENKNQLKERISMIAKFRKANRWPVLAVGLFAGLALITLTDARSEGPSATPAAEAPVGTPHIVATSPEVAATNVDPALSEITVTFDQDMAGGFSWTGGGPDYPPIPEGQKPQWRDKRTCVLPVKLEAGRYYRVGINSTSYRNFRSVAGVSAIPSAIYFTTVGASAETIQQMFPPRIVATSPAIGATEVDPALSEITVTFDQDMGGGFSWTGGGPDYPPTPEGQKAQWRDKRTCVLPVKLEAGRYYRVGINSTSYQNFANEHGVAARPAAIYFTTLGASEELKLKTQIPQVVSFEPANGAINVNAGLTEVRVTFNVPMGGGFSWCGDGPEYPKGRAGKGPYWTEDHLTCVLPVELAPGSTYRVWLNSPSHKNFQSAAGVPLEPVEYTFKTLAQ